jgi:ABC-type transport system involved in cytochrome bd biosynthesis fused ATPase/permease subunit
MLTIFFLAIIPLFYSIMAIYDFGFQDIQVALSVSVTIVLLATIMTILHWENNKKKLHELYLKKETYLTTVQAQQAAAQLLQATEQKSKKKK